MRRPLVAGNWKMNGTRDGAVRLAAELVQGLDATVTAPAKALGNAEVVLCPSFVHLADVSRVLKDSGAYLGAQDVCAENNGAYTGEVSALMLKDFDCRYVIVGHSERRQFFGDNDGTVAQKAKAAVAEGLTPIVCVGESLADREEGRTKEVLSQQFLGGPASLTPEEFSRILLAYEPVWAIGTGRTATPEIAGAAHAFIRSCVQDQFSAEVAASVRILYGGSVKPDNIQGLKAQPDLDGALVGGASLQAKSFAAIVNSK